MNKGVEALKEYRRQVEAGEIEPAQAMNPMEKSEANPKSLRAAINAKCWDCCCQSRSDVRDCEATDCPLWKLRPWTVKDDK